MTDVYLLHYILRGIAGLAVSAFFTRIHVIGGENVPLNGPAIVTCTHHNMMLDPALLSNTFPKLRVLHYWSKASLFVNPFFRSVLLRAGNIPVDRKSKDRMVLFKGTFEALAKGSVVALFPEGTSYTEPRIMQVKDGASWAALEYLRWTKENPGKTVDKELVIIPTTIVYTNKSKYRSDVIVEYGTPIKLDIYLEQFLSSEEGASRLAVKRLTNDIQQALVNSTINAPDWDTLYAARMARALLWQDERSINLDDFVEISQTLVDLFSNPDITPNFTSVKRRLIEYYSLLQSTGLINSVLSSLPLPPSLDPSQPVPLPSRVYTLLILFRDSLSLAIRIPFFFFPLIVHTPIYIMGRIGAQLVEDEEETQAQNKVVLGLLLLMLIYPAAFFILWAFMWYTPVGALFSAGMVWLFALYHNRLINDNYERGKRLIAAWRVLVGVWAPKNWDMPLTALSQYTTPIVPPENPWIQRSAIPSHEPTPPSTSTITASSSTDSRSAQSGEKKKRRRKPPTRQVIRHILRARAEAVRALVSFFAQLEKGPAEERRVRASPHLATRYGTAGSDQEPGWRNAREVILFLRKRGAGVKGLEHSISIEGEWAAAERDGTMSSDWEESSDAGSGLPSGLGSISLSRSEGLGVGSGGDASVNSVPSSPLAK